MHAWGTVSNARQDKSRQQRMQPSRKLWREQSEMHKNVVQGLYLAVEGVEERVQPGCDVPTPLHKPAGLTHH